MFPQKSYNLSSNNNIKTHYPVLSSPGPPRGSWDDLVGPRTSFLGGVFSPLMLQGLTCTDLLCAVGVAELNTLL